MPAEPSLPLPEFVNWPIFPFVGSMTVRELEEPLDAEYPRNGEPGNSPCHCETDEDRFGIVWSDDRWLVSEIRLQGKASPFPAYMLETVEHQDFGDLNTEMAAEYGVLSVRLERAINALDSVGRVHINRWGDGGSHFHVWFLGRPRGAWQLSGFSLAMWLHILPPLSPAEILHNNARVAAGLETNGAS